LTHAAKKQNIDWMKRNSISLTTLILVGGLFMKQAAWQQKITDEIQILNEHRESGIVHMPLSEKLQIFATRNELSDLKKTIETINENVKILLNNEISKKNK